MPMSWHRDGPPGGRRGYHHGNLREALIEAALKLISEKGPAGVTFAEAARAAGVSPAAPYRHFRDRDALMADVARRGFERFDAARWPRPGTSGQPDAARRLRARGARLPGFCARGAGLFLGHVRIRPRSGRLPGSARGRRPRLRACCETPARRVVAPLPPEKRPPAMMMALHIWSLSHGIAALFGRGDGARRPIPMTPEELLEAAVADLPAKASARGWRRSARHGPSE